MKTISEALEVVENIDKVCYESFNIKQFTIDLIETFMQKLNACMMGESDNTDEDVLGSLSYNASCALEICDKDINDYKVIQDLFDAVN